MENKYSTQKMDKAELQAAKAQFEEQKQKMEYESRIAYAKGKYAKWAARKESYAKRIAELQEQQLKAVAGTADARHIAEELAKYVALNNENNEKLARFD